jgi:opacity protein-like surface antigen
MKQPNIFQTLFATSLTLAFALAPLSGIRAELVSEEIQEDAIIPEQSALEEEVLILKKKPRAAPRKRIVVQEEEDLPLQPAYAPASAPAKQSTGSVIDQGVQNKMDEVKSKFEEAILRSLDRIQVSVDEGGSAPAPMTTTVVQDTIVTTESAPAYMSLDSAPVLAIEEPAAESVAKAETGEFVNRVRVSPLIGWTTINSDFYNIDSRYTAGLNIEVDMSDNLAIVLGYSYSQFDIGLGGSNPFFGSHQPGFYQGNMTTLEYNQNVFDAGLRFYLFPQQSKFRAFLGGGAGYNKGYLNYRKNVFNTFAGNPYANLEDYEVTSFLGILETGAELTVAKNISVGANFKYSNVLSSSENQSLNHYGFMLNGFGSNVSQDQRVVGGSIAENSFYSILGTVKISF